MTEPDEIDLERELTQMTQYPGETPQLWQRALRQSQMQGTGFDRLRSWFDRLSVPVGPWRVAALVIFASAVVLIPLLNPSLSRPRARSSSSMAIQSDPQLSSPALQRSSDASHYKIEGALAQDRQGTFVEGGGGEKLRRDVTQPYSNQDVRIAAAEQRQVVRKASVELRTDDVRAAFVKAQLLVSQANGEYIEDSTISGDGEHMQADLTLRVSATRLSEVLNSLHDIGKVVSQQMAGEDVTAQVVDIDARLNNERRVETELLQLLESRKDSDLKDILELRNNISQVRGEIERLEAQQQHLSRLVSLATVVVIIRHDGQPKEVTEPGIGAYFAGAMTSAWKRGVTGLADSIAWLAATLVGGLIWWTVAGIALWLAWRQYVRAGRAQKGE